VPALQVSPIIAAFDHPEVILDPGTVPTVALALVEAFCEVPDPRQSRGIRHGVAAILLLGACAVLTGARSFAAIGEYAHDTGRTILDQLGVGSVVPHGSTIRRVLQDLDPDAVEAAMRSWVLDQLSERPAPVGVPVREQRQVLAVDGKTVPDRRGRAAGPGRRRSHPHEGARPQPLGRDPGAVYRGEAAVARWADPRRGPSGGAVGDQVIPPGLGSSWTVPDLVDTRP